MPQRIGVLASKASERGAIRRCVDGVFAELPAEVLWEFRYYSAPQRLATALHDGTLQLAVVVQSDEQYRLSDFGMDNIVVVRADAAAAGGELSLSRLSPQALHQAIRQGLKRREVDAQLSFLADHDPNTDLPRGDAFFRNALQLTKHGEHSLLCVVLDEFAEVEATLGNASADRLLRMAAERLREHTGAHDVLAYGDVAEFLLVPKRTLSVTSARQLGKKLCQALSKPFDIMDSRAYVTPRIGIAGLTSTFTSGRSAPDGRRAADDTASLAALKQSINDARCAASAASELPHPQVKAFAAKTDRRGQRRAVAEALGSALDKEEFEVFYQPIICLSSGAFTGAEALLRWHGQSVGDLSPAQFIPIAEESGAIIPIGDWVLKQACRDAVGWIDRYWLAVRLAINVSAHQFHDGRILEQLRTLLIDLPLRPEQIELEMPEQVYLEQIRHNGRLFHDLRNFGVRLCLDDFGTGYASLGYLKQHPVDVLKIDRSFVASLPHSDSDASLVRAMIAMGQHLGMRVVAVGVETDEQLEFLRMAGCHEAQGFYLGRPMPGEELVQLILRHPPVETSKPFSAWSQQTA